MSTFDRMKRMDSVSEDARELANKIAPLLKQLDMKLKAEGTQPEDMSASYILLQAAAGFVASEDGRHRAYEHLDFLAKAAADDILEPQVF